MMDTWLATFYAYKGLLLVCVLMNNYYCLVIYECGLFLAVCEVVFLYTVFTCREEYVTWQVTSEVRCYKSNFAISPTICCKTYNHKNVFNNLTLPPQCSDNSQTF